ncbi:amidase [Mesorhizobium sp. J428]|uniref:amidase n=1 Tax=Mesorhizobium sp. J428 TaxID=2898440 RepID=UPI002151359F|nr:amidase [Mesorhizobium sp. J428]MCR5856432.1 amidase [Mesorhizobium sp. J428]
MSQLVSVGRPEGEERGGSAGAERLTASEAARLIRDRRLTAGELARACIDRTLLRDEQIHAWTVFETEMVLAQASERDAEPLRGPLHGVPVGIKDILFTRDLPTTYNSPHFQSHHPNMDAAVVSLLRAAGAVVFGKNDTVEFAVNGRRARTRNPHDLRRTPGGSSSGSAAAVADFQVPLSIGTQTGGSVIRPASYCGVWGMKPTWNAVSAEGMKVCAPSIDTLGWYGRSAQDIALLCDVFRIVDDEPVALPSIDGARIAICRSPVWHLAEQPTRDALDLCADLFHSHGAEVTFLDLPESFDGLTAAHKVVMQSEMRSTFLPEFLAFGHALYPELVATMRNDSGFSRADLRAAYDLAATCRARFDELAASYTAVLTPSVAGIAPIGLEDTGAATFNRIWTLLHTPCVNVPGLSGPDGMPIGVTMTGPRFCDRRVLEAARLFGDLLDLRTREGQP